MTYIGQNAVKVGLAEKPEAYAWSSASERWTLDEPRGFGGMRALATEALSG